MAIKLNEFERMVINIYLSLNWAEFYEVAEMHMDAKDIEQLAFKLEGKQ